MTSYAKTARTRVKRVPERGRYDRETVHAILDAGLICHVGFVADGQPLVIPTLHWRDGERLLIHGSSASRMIRVLAAGAEACVTVTLFDGLVLARSAFHHSVNYRSVVVLGTATAIEDPGEKTAVLSCLMERIVPGRWAEVRGPTAQELKATGVLAFPLDEVSAKLREGPPKDDEEDYALSVWAGVVPVRLVADPPVADPRLDPATPVPAYAVGWVA
jgi:nitroimidazol reductase NimA-like FMN-containing flavoprotein (pyridoxamine 5'-phosphate oxidase superfamily)